MTFILIILLEGSNGSSNNGVGENKEDEIINLTQYGDDSDDSVKSIPVTASSAPEKQSTSRRSRSRFDLRKIPI